MNNENWAVKILVFLIGTPLATMLRGCVLSVLWHWFMVPQFHISEMSIPIALGVSTLVSLLTVDSTLKREKEEWWMYYITESTLSLAALLFGWLYQMFV